MRPIYEPVFLGFSYGFRPGRGAHDALDALAYCIDERKVNWIVECDIVGFFDNLDRDWMLRFLEHRIGDRRVLRLIRKWLSAGIMDGFEWRDDLRGTPQGSSISPLLANVYLHYVLDLWFQRHWRPRVARGESIIVRYADDFVLGFQHRHDAERLMSDLKARLARFSLEVHPDKTRLLEFGRHAAANRRARGLRRPETFDFLGFTHYCRTTRTGRFGLGRKPIRKRVDRTLQRLKAELRRRMHHDRIEVALWLGRVVNGWLGYYAVPTSFPFLKQFLLRLLKLWLRVLRRRSQKDRYTLAKVGELAQAFWPPLRIRHPWPNQRFAVNHSR